MQVKLVCYTPELHRLVEATARVCYQSYHKMSPTSYSMIKGILATGHLSVASVGNMVFEVTHGSKALSDYTRTLEALLSFKQINNYVRWVTPHCKGARTDFRTITLSMNMLTLLSLINNRKNYINIAELLGQILAEVDKVPCLRWFYDPATEVPHADSPYIAEPSLGSPVVLTEDYTALKAKGFTNTELDVHATVTVDMVTDRATGLQMWRHGDMTGGCELSQRYCDRSNAVVREMAGIADYPEGLANYVNREGLTEKEGKEHYDAVAQALRNQYQSSVDSYHSLDSALKELGVSSKRAKEIARSVLPNAMTTRIIQCRPLRQWKHFMQLRDTVHAQPEIREDAASIRDALSRVGVSIYPESKATADSKVLRASEARYQVTLDDN